MLNKCYKASPKKPGHLLHIQNPTQKKACPLLLTDLKSTLPRSETVAFIYIMCI